MKVDHQQPFVTYVALGDSLTVGVGASFLAPGFVGQYVRLLEKEQHVPVCTNIYAKSGIETDGVLNIIENQTVYNKIEHANIISISAGGNDLIQASKDFIESGEAAELAQSVKECHSNMVKIMTTIHRLKKECGVPYRIYLLNLYNPLPQIQLAEKWVKLFNQHLNSFHNGKTIFVADLYSVFKGKQEELLSRDRIHPNNLGYKKIAEQLIALGYPTF
ncbi:GDSL-type esterase/lipase family protein [Metabacillus litoralis]|uniref:GDSL-type esterase/lipase family protein n=1 Tax=Metabacillus litoralis TaxID=152268 RepID=UPI001CFD38DB|nr:GDSL-type esterase/lipase family protein [Metabacillus litoralis]